MADSRIKWVTRYRARCELCPWWVPPLRDVREDSDRDAAEHNAENHMNRADDSAGSSTEEDQTV